MKPYLSIILPSIRPHRLVSLYHSITASTSRSFELIICGPYPLPDELRDIKNIKYVKDYGSPVRASNIAASLCEGEVCTWIADDCLLFENALERCIEEFESMGDETTNVLVSKYYEGQDNSVDRSTLQNDNYFKIHPDFMERFQPMWYLF